MLNYLETCSVGFTADKEACKGNETLITSKKSILQFDIWAKQRNGENEGSEHNEAGDVGLKRQRKPSARRSGGTEERRESREEKEELRTDCWL